MTATNLLNSGMARITRPFTHFRYRLCSRLDRWRIAFDYARQRLSKEDAASVSYDCDQIIGEWALESISVSGVLEEALLSWQPHPDLPDLAYEAAKRVWNKWESDGNLTNAALEWAINLIEELAEERGITLVSSEQGGQ